MRSSKNQFNTEKSIAIWLKQFAKHKAYNDGAIQEMELHLRDHIDDLINQGKTEEEAFSLAVAEFGQIPKIANEEYSNIRRKMSLKTLIFSTMLNNYFKTTTRHMLKNPLTSFINVFGLSVAIGICIMVYAFFVFDHNLDQFHENKNEVYLSTFFVDRDGEEEQYGLSPLPLATMLEQDFSQIEITCRVKDRNMVLKYGDKVFQEQVRYADPTFLEMLTFPLKWGVSSSLKDPNSIILSENMAIKYFGEENPIGQSLQVIFNVNKSKTYTVSGVAMPFPKAHIIEFDFLINFENYGKSYNNFDDSDWTHLVDATLISISNPEGLQTIQQGMEKYKLIQNEKERDWKITNYNYVKLADLHFQSSEIEGDISGDDNIEARQGLPIIAIIMLALACFNYINISIVSAAKRMKEIGLRKVIGANRRLIILQFLSENVLLTFFSLLIGLIMAVTVFVPWFGSLTGEPMDFQLVDVNLWLFLVVVLLFTGVSSGIYPALYISKFESVSILKGSIKIGKKNTFTKVFLGIQLILTCAGITCAVIFAQNNTYQNNRSWGYDQHGALYAMVEDQSSFEKLQESMTRNPDVVSLSGSSHHLGKNTANQIVSTPVRDFEVKELSVDANYFKTLDIQLLHGRTFMEHFQSDQETIVVNETLVNNLLIENPIGHFLKIGEIKYEIVGIVKDFHMYNFFNTVEPTIFRVAKPEHYRFLSLRVLDGTELKVYNQLKSEWAELFPEIPFQGGFQKDVWPGYFELLNTAERFYKVIAFIAVMLASLGLYGLITLNVVGRIKEFSIRKTLGAGIKDLTFSVAKQYLVLLFISLLIGVPFSYYMAQSALDQLYAYPMPMTSSGLIVAVFILVGILALVISTQIRKVSKFNPVEGLKSE